VLKTSLTKCFAEYEQRTSYGALAVTLATLLRLINCRFIIIIIIMYIGNRTGCHSGTTNINVTLSYALDGVATLVVVSAAGEFVGILARRTMVVQLTTEAQVTRQTLHHRHVTRQELHIF